MDNLKSKYIASIKLSAMADALGWITEFEKSEVDLIKKYDTNRITKFHPWSKNVGGRFYGYVDYIKEGSYSDDTQLMLAVARSINSSADVDQVFFAKNELPNWLYYARGGGRTIKQAADKIQRKSANWYSNFYTYSIKDQKVDYRDTGANGAAMRVLPIALANFKNEENIKANIFSNSIITHGHPRVLLGAMLYGVVINRFLSADPNNFEFKNVLTEIGSNFNETFNLSFLNSVELLKWEEEWNKSSDISFRDTYDEICAETQEYLRVVFKSLNKDVTVYETLDKLGCFANQTKGSGTSTVIGGLYLALKFVNNPEEGILQAVNALGTDTDSIAAFTGSLLGALHGEKIIPNKWNNVQDVTYLEGIAEKLYLINKKKFKDKEDFLLAPVLKSANKPKTDNFQINEEIEFSPLGKGKIIEIDRQKTLTKGKYNLILSINLDIGQSIIVTYIFDENEDTTYLKDSIKSDEFNDLLVLAKSKLKPFAYKDLEVFLKNNNSNDILNIFKTIIENKA